MKKIAIFLLAIVLFSTISYAQQRYDNYFKLWEEVQQFETYKLPKSALVVVERIYAKAKNEGNSPQITKVLLYKSKYALILEEDARSNIINSFKNEISSAEFPTKNILESVLANLYWQYFQQNRYKFYNRTKTTEKVDVADFRTWDLQTLFKEIHHHFQSSLRNGLVSQQTDLLKFNAILELQKDSKKYRPTLFDFLSHNALDFYKTSETSISSPAYKFELTKDDFFAHIKFSGDKSYRFQTEKDSLSLQLNALKIYQNLIAFHTRNNNSDALVTVVLERLKFVKNHATFSDKDDLFLTMLKELKEAHKSAEASTLVDFEIAAVFNNKAATYHHINNTEHQFDRTKALDICNDAIHKFPKSLGAEKCQILKQQIKSKTLTITAEKNISIQKHSKLLLSYKNVEKLYFNIYKIDEKGAAKFRKIYKDAAKVEFIKKLDFITRFNESLKTENDYQQHQTEIVIPPLNNGKYLIYVSTFETLNSNSVHATSIIQVTDIAVVEDKQNNTTIYQVVNRNNGKPLIGATVTIKNYNTGRYNKPINRNYISDKNGQLKFKTTNSYRNVVLTVSFNNEIASFGDYYISEHRNYNKLPDKVTIHPFLFTDRSIYRPGQTVYFKGIFIEKEGVVSAPFSEELVSAALYNVNYEKIEELELETNEFGAVSGVFILPNNGLLGQYSINVKAMGLVNKNFYFSVEEYKRPKFETDFKPVTATYRINDSIRIEGNAIAYAGSNISNAKVVYRVHRKVQYPRWYYWYRPNFISAEAQEITHGETITDDRGNFNVTFKAIPDKSVNKEDLPIFIYEVTADITDINGETRSASADVKVGYHTLTAQVTIAEKIDKNSKENNLIVETKNLNNEVISAKGLLRIFKLTAPENVLRKRPWNAPDYQTLSKSAFKNLFPHEAYSNEDEIRNWQKGALVFESTFDTSKSTDIALKRIKKWLSGKYIVELEAKDKFDQIVTDKQVFSVFSEEEDHAADKLLFIISTNKANYKPNEKVVLKIGSASKDLYVTMEVEKDKKIIDTKIIHLNNEVKQIEIPVYEKDLGGFVIHYSFSNFNSFKSGSLAISVPYPINELEIETSTFRDKLQPGQNETWSFKLKGNKGDKIAAELLASMYDASLDQFKLHNWQFNPIQKPIYYSYNNKRAHQSFGNEHFSVKNLSKFYADYPQQYFDRLDWFGFSFGNNGMFYALRGKTAGIESKRMNDQIEIVEYDEEVEEMAFSTGANLDEIVVTGIEKKEQTDDTTEETSDMSPVKIRKNFNETAFFYPHLKTDANGNVSFNFTVPEALTRWKLQLLAHTKELASATKTLTTVTQKELMVLPNPPRFLREGDQIVFSSKISNMSAKNLSGAAILELTDAITGKDITVEMSNRDSIEFIVDAKGNTNVSWSLQVPDDVQAIQYKIIAKAEDFSDGEQNVLPVLSNRMLVTETLPMWVRSNQTKTFSLDKLINNTSTTLKNHKLTLEITSNPAWYAVQSLPYLMEYPYECSEQTFSRYYANVLAGHIVNSNPRIQEVFNQWKSTNALLSNLEKNQELKSIIIQETPWLRDAQSETEQKKRIALLFDLNKMNNELQSAINKLKQLQFGNGGFPWFKGSRYPNRYITQHIATGFGHLKQLNVVFSNNNESSEMIAKSVKFLDDEILNDYTKLLQEAKKIRKQAKTKQKGVKDETNYLAKNHLGHTQLHYLYMRSFYTNLKITENAQTAIDYYTKQSAKYWKDYQLYSKGLIALIQHRNDNSSIANAILKSLKENSITSEELGMYWKENTSSWRWYQAPVETQALLIEVFSEIKNDVTTVDELKVWLLKNKQTNSWKTTKATTEAVYALLLQGSDWLSLNESVDVAVGNQKIEPSTLENVTIEAGTGYYKTSWNGNEILPEMGEVTITKKDNGIAWGGLYWQYFEDLDKITSAETPLKLSKKLFLKSNADTGKLLTEINENSSLKVGDLITVRIELKVDRPMEFVHMKDLRASGLEPINVLSQYKWQDGLGYYESTKDASTNFFMEYLPKGVYVFEYDLRVNNAGNFSDGITSIQSMYAPEFSSHSEGVRLVINN